MTNILWAEPARVRHRKYHASGSKHSVQWMPITLLQAASLQLHKAMCTVGIESVLMKIYKAKGDVCGRTTCMDMYCW